MGIFQYGLLRSFAWFRKLFVPVEDTLGASESCSAQTPIDGRMMRDPMAGTAARDPETIGPGVIRRYHKMNSRRHGGWEKYIEGLKERNEKTAKLVV